MYKQYRGPGLQGRELNLIIEAVEDRIRNINNLVSGSAGSTVGGVVSSDDCLDVSAPGVRAIIVRDIQRTISRIENRTKLNLYPRRYTNFAQRPQEVYEDRVKFGEGRMNSFLTPESKIYPTWNDLEPDQQAMYVNDPSNYEDGTFPYDLLTLEQQQKFAREVIHVPNKGGEEEKLDGRNRAYVKLEHRYITKIYKLALEVHNPPGFSGIPFFNRAYSPGEYMLYPEEGAVLIFPAQAKISAMASNLWTSTSYGMTVPGLPQVLRADYEAGLREIPEDLQDAISLLAARRVLESVNIAYTKGMMGFAVQGFSLQFGRGMFVDVLERYKQEADEILAQYHQFTMTGWAS